MAGKFQVTCFLIIFLIIVAVCLTIILEIGVLIMLNLTYTIERPSSTLESLSKEAMAVMDVYKNMSERFIEKNQWLMTGVMDATTYPLDWTSLATGIPKFSTVLPASLTADPDFGGNEIAKSQMTYVLANDAITNEFTLDELQRLNILNEVWKKVNLVKLGYEFDVDITSSFFMIKDTIANKEILVTFPGQGATVSTFTDYDFYNEAMTNTSEYITISLTDDPFNTGMQKVVGSCRGFTIAGKYEGVVGIFYKSDTFTKLLNPVVKKADNSDACKTNNI
mmetsp:Transcript_17056/g.15005  ORF Transcript_17056/g.15005 Transcript_17056/m.15005 type:complete len:279 (+) Transcript_17056:99-935(+)